ncbi:YiiX/YebB-like N1pC/P60 family cysteine hydrolase [Heyndrickxia sporothermodurans]|uniref:YiiX/YebB-like N1pC/P60 family cysteine hydrolase n=1 Tax=Heyndrickxia sporothermodurans TaxID=46224 RepID=UPI002E20AEC8|nr:YiiX/YebB-like N1pC/P60 family cysteine hydrolase [Heyndrickxia sporothermodurans]MED3697537.1 YiiX/YebB-like N1pC/P60 family cysteine hydrolase [Heyndrickxia sporothermodurans]
MGLAKSFLNKPYNFAFGNKTTTDKFYCSQLVWRAWQLMGYDLDYNRGKFVWPGDLKKSSLLN